MERFARLAAGGRQRLAWYRGRRAFVRSIRPSDAFIVTYLRSGTTWVRFFLATLQWVHDQPARPQPEIRDLQEWIPDINELYRRSPLAVYSALPDPRIFSVHAPYDSALPRVVYIVRDPRAVMVSYYHYHRRQFSDFHMTMDEFVARNTMWPGDWGAHVTGWLEHAASSHIMVVKYEDLSADPVRWLARVAHHCGLGASTAEVERAAELSSFARMAESEREHGVGTAVADPSVPFIRRGQVRGWADELSAESAALLTHRYQNLLMHFGYPTDTWLGTPQAGEEAPKYESAQ